MPTLTIRDESATGESLHEWELTDLSDRITVRELIRSRVYQEVRDRQVRRANTRDEPLPTSPEGRVLAARAASGLVTSKAADPAKVDWRKQVEIACRAFEAGGLIVLIDDAQVTSLETEFDVGPSTDVAFLRLTPLIGG